MDDKFVISPSLCFLLSFTNLKLDINYIPYHSDLKMMLGGINRHVDSIPCKGKERISVCHFRNIHVDDNLNINIKYKNIASPAFNNYKEYYTFLINILKIFNENATDQCRKIKYAPLVTISSGYDSPACSVIARSIGCKEAVTFSEARGEENIQGSDSGKPIADILGLLTEEFDRNSYHNKAGHPEAEFVASGDMGRDFELCAFEDKWQQRMVIVGNHGWFVWSRGLTKKHLEIPLYRLEYEGDSWIDFKFRVGFIACNLPCFGLLSRKALYKINHSYEMRPYWLGTNYDRPIARRIVEEAGVPRHLFGQKKKAASVLLNRNGNLKKYMKKESYDSFLEYYKNDIKKRNIIKHYYFSVMYALYNCNAWVASNINKIFDIAKIRIVFPQIISVKYSESPGQPSCLVHWGIENIRHRYLISSK